METTLPNVSEMLTPIVDGVVGQGLLAIGVVFAGVLAIVGATTIWNLGVSLVRRIRA